MLTNTRLEFSLVDVEYTWSALKRIVKLIIYALIIIQDSNSKNRLRICIFINLGDSGNCDNIV